MERTFYTNLPYNFYQMQYDSSRFFKLFWHRKRQNQTRDYVNRYYSNGDKILDIGCGNSVWNTGLLPVVGLDINDKMLEYNLERKTISEKIIGTFEKVKLPEEFYDIIVMTEFLEHFKDFYDIIKKVRSILKSGGIVITSVPYEGALSFWRPLFKTQCFIKGNFFIDAYYKNKCGHTTDFDKQNFIRLFEENKFLITEYKLIMRMTQFIVAKNVGK